MRDTFFVLLFLAGTYAGVRYFQSYTAAPQANSNQVQAKPLSAKNSSIKGEVHDAKTKRDGENPSLESDGEDERGSADSAEAVSLSTIYRQKRKASKPATVANQSRGLRAKKVLLGVRVEDWVEAHSEVLPTDLTPEEERQMRVFLQCMEWRRDGLEYIGLNQCRDLVNETEARKGIHPRL